MVLHKLFAVTFDEELGIARNHPKRFLQIVTGGKGELAQILGGAAGLDAPLDLLLCFFPLGYISENKDNADLSCPLQCGSELRCHQWEFGDRPSRSISCD